MALALPPGIRQKRPGYYEVRVYGGKDPLTGRQRQVSRAVRGTLKEAQALRAALITEVETQGVAASSNVTELFAAVIQHLESIGREATTIVGYRQIAKDAGEQFGATLLRKLRASHLDGYYAHMLKNWQKSGHSEAASRLHPPFPQAGLQMGMGSGERR
jgi:integrase